MCTQVGSLLRSGFVVAFCFASSFVYAADAPLLMWKDSSEGIGGAHVNAEVTRQTPSGDREVVVSDPRAVTKILDQLHVYRRLADQARRENFDRSPVLSAAIVNAADRELGQRYLNQLLDAHEAKSSTDWTSAAKEYYASNRNGYRLPEEYDAAHILLSFKDYSNQSAAIDEAKKIVSQLRAGANFADFAKQYSADNSNRDRGGELGVLRADAITREFRATISALKNKGDISEPVRTPFGLHIIKLNSRSEERLKPFDEVKEEIIAELKERSRQSRREEILGEFRRDPSLKVNDAAFEAFTGAKRISPR